MPEPKTRKVGRFSRLPTYILAIIGLVVVVGVPVGAFYAYRTYDYVQHDNDFCMSCHLMAEPFERFARSEHRGLGCKACHQPTLAARSQMALTQIIESPEELGVHAVVPNRVCAACHIEGDPEKWELIANSAGHRVHLESTDPSLEGLNCVECHSTSLHEFAATDVTCGQSSCHENTEINLGRMGDFAIHCAACHGFSEVVPPTESAEVLAAALQPSEGECLSCHAMREAVQMPADDPHEGVCASCHNPHSQTAAAQAVESCATAGCHTEVEEITDFHRGLAPATLQNCLTCHTAHDFKVDGLDCRGCHSDLLAPGSSPAGSSPAGSGRRGAGAAPLGAGPEPSVATGTGRAAEAPLSSPFLHVASSGPRPPSITPSGSLLHSGTVAQQAVLDLAADSVVFRHDTHVAVDCLSCHATDGSHGRITVTTNRECRSCHHTEPLRANCSSCHTGGDAFRARSYALGRTLDRSVGGEVRRSLPFDHSIHLDADCAACHAQESIDLSAANVDCTQCHEDHHLPEARCASCHVVAPLSAHPVAQVHVGCTGNGCHTDLPFEASIPRTRNFCVTCHQDQEEHRVGEGPCIDCHAVGEPWVGKPWAGEP